jgi:hypothetical protein
MSGCGRRSPAKERTMKVEVTVDLNRIFFEEGHLIDEALKKGVRDAIMRHKKEGLPVVICRNGDIVWVHPEELDK